MSDMKNHWFVPKTHGYGAAPANWRGWAAVLGFVLATTAISLPLMVWPALDGTGPSVWQLIGWLILLLGATAAFISLCKSKTDGEWRWRWGNKT